MNHKLIIKNFQGFEIRTVIIDKQIWFVARDIFQVLGKATKSGNDFEGLDEDERGVFKIHTSGGVQDMVIVSESGFYSLVMKSRKPIAKPFQKWVTKEVLPSIRKTGTYSLSQEQEKPERISPKEIQELNQYLSEFIKMAHLCEFKGNQAILSADKGVRNITGHSPLKLLDEIHLVANEKTKIFTPTQLGKEIGKTAMEMNLLLADIGFQKKIGKIWEVLEDGKKFAELLDTNKKHSDGTPVKQIKWQKEVLEKIKIEKSEPTLF